MMVRDADRYRDWVSEDFSHVLGHCDGTCGCNFGHKMPEDGGIKSLFLRRGAGTVPAQHPGPLCCNIVYVIVNDE